MQQQETKLQRTQTRALGTVFQGKPLSIVEMHRQAKIDNLTEKKEPASNDTNKTRDCNTTESAKCNDKEASQSMNI